MLFQIDTTALADELMQAEQPIQESINLWEMAQYGGWIMIILAVLLAFACYIFIERLVVLKQATQEDKIALAQVNTELKDYNFKLNGGKQNV